MLQRGIVRVAIVRFSGGRMISQTFEDADSEVDFANSDVVTADVDTE